jgi:hypothetical protein
MAGTHDDAVLVVEIAKWGAMSGLGYRRLVDLPRDGLGHAAMFSAEHAVCNSRLAHFPW